MKIIIIAWRNIWRTPWRSLVVIGAMSLGVWSGIFMMGWANGLNDQRTISILDDNIGHGRICSRYFLEDQEVFSTINELKPLEKLLLSDSNITTFFTFNIFVSFELEVGEKQNMNVTITNDTHAIKERKVAF